MRRKQLIIIIILVALLVLTGCDTRKFSTYPELEKGFDETGLKWGMSYDEVGNIVPGVNKVDDYFMTLYVLYENVWSCHYYFYEDALDRVSMHLIGSDKMENYKEYKGFDTAYFEQDIYAVYDKVLSQMMEVLGPANKMTEQSGESITYNWELNSTKADLYYDITKGRLTIRYYAN